MANLAARQSDAVRTGHPCTGTTQLDTPTQDKVFIEGKLAARKDDLTVSHTEKTGEDNFGNDICTPHTAPITGSSSTVYIAGKLAARKTDACDAGEITGSASKTYIG
jgi:uncharacterized Zn-binding protein involved in type VI secretion